MLTLPILSPTLLALWTVANVIVLLSIALLVTRWLRDKDTLAHTQVDLAQSHSLMQAALESAATGIMVMDLEQNVLTCNPKFRALWNLPDGWAHFSDYEERIQYQGFQVIDPASFYQRSAEWQNTSDPSAGGLIEFRDGRVIQCTVMPYRVDGQIQGKLYVYIDITERQQAEAQIQNLLNQEQIRLRRLEDLRTASANILIEVNQRGLLRSIVLNAASLLEAGACELYLIKTDTREFFLASGAGGDGSPTGEALPFIPPGLQDQVIRDRRSLLLAPTEDIPSGGPRSLIIVPLLNRRETIGILTVTETHRLARFNTDDRQLLELFAQQAAIAVQNAQLFEEVNRLATTDGLTGIYNRHQFMILAQQELERVRRFSTPFTLVMFDIDHFKQVNDEQGHPIGDQVLHWLAQTCRGGLRGCDILGRYGGEEFLVLLPNTTILDGMMVAERLRVLVGRAPFQSSSGNLSITISLGVVTWTASLPSLEALIERADQALYHSKQTGRNKMTGMDAITGSFLPGIFAPGMPLPPPLKSAAGKFNDA